MANLAAATAYDSTYEPGPVVIKKDDEPLLNLTGAMSRC
jgi:hypothetical protein